MIFKSGFPSNDPMVWVKVTVVEVVPFATSVSIGVTVDPSTVTTLTLGKNPRL